MNSLPVCSLIEHKHWLVEIVEFIRCTTPPSAIPLNSFLHRHLHWTARRCAHIAQCCESAQVTTVMRLIKRWTALSERGVVTEPGKDIHARAGELRKKRRPIHATNRGEASGDWKTPSGTPKTPQCANGRRRACGPMSLCNVASNTHRRELSCCLQSVGASECVTWITRELSSQRITVTSAAQMKGRRRVTSTREQRVSKTMGSTSRPHGW